MVFAVLEFCAGIIGTKRKSVFTLSRDERNSLIRYLFPNFLPSFVPFPGDQIDDPTARKPAATRERERLQKKGKKGFQSVNRTDRSYPITKTSLKHIFLFSPKYPRRTPVINCSTFS